MKIALEQLIEEARGEHGKKKPPIEQWHPEKIVDSLMMIDSQGRWFHEGIEIERLPLIQLFASILRLEDDAYFLITPTEKHRLTVQDVPFLIINLVEPCDGPAFFVSNCEDVIPVTADTRFSFNAYQGQQVPYLLVRDNLQGRVSRQLYYQLIERAIEGDDDSYYLVLNQQKLWLMPKGQ